MTPSPFRTLALFALLCGGLQFCGDAFAQGFSALVSPPRFEDSAKPGETYRNIIEIGNASSASAHFAVRTADWTLKPDAGIEFSDALAPGSCRPWVGIEAAEINLAPNGKRRYRFEVRVPADAPSGECRFAIMIEGDPGTPNGSSVPVSGRIGVIVYLAIGDAAPDLAMTGYSVRTMDGSLVPMLSVRNGGNAHGRLQGFVDGTDASGKRYAFAPTALPILPGETRDIALVPQADRDDQPPPALTWPVQIEGWLDAGKQRLDIAKTFSK
ncbi:MAG TPA: hypothetical protein VJ806_06635 [Luteimonas sp.]|nr:hypothetical protein [Luteimonas sp.]